MIAKFTDGSFQLTSKDEVSWTKPQNDAAVKSQEREIQREKSDVI